MSSRASWKGLGGMGMRNVLGYVIRAQGMGAGVALLSCPVTKVSRSNRKGSLVEGTRRRLLSGVQTLLLRQEYSTLPFYHISCSVVPL